MTSNSTGMAEVQQKYEANLKSLTEQIAALTKEKEDLHKALTNKAISAANPNAAK